MTCAVHSPAADRSGATSTSVVFVPFISKTRDDSAFPAEMKSQGLGQKYGGILAWLRVVGAQVALHGFG